MTRTYYRDFVTRRPVDPTATAYARSQKLDDPSDRHRFMAAYRLGRRFEELGMDSYVEFQRAWEACESVTLAGLIEGHASVGRSTFRPVNERGEPVHRPTRRRLTDRQKEVLVCAAKGMTHDETAAYLGTGRETVVSHLKLIRKRLKAKNTTHAVTLALATGQIAMYELRG